MTITEHQKQLAMERADSLSQLFRDGAVSLLTGKADPQEATPILDRLIELLRAAGVDTDTILEDALTIAQAQGMIE